MKQPSVEDYEESDSNYLTSGIGNAYFSGMSMADLWDCVMIGGTAAGIDAAISAKLKLDEIIKEVKNDRK